MPEDYPRCWHDLCITSPHEGAHVDATGATFDDNGDEPWETMQDEGVFPSWT